MGSVADPLEIRFTITSEGATLAKRTATNIQYKLCVLVLRCLNSADLVVSSTRRSTIGD